MNTDPNDSDAETFEQLRTMHNDATMEGRRLRLILQEAIALCDFLARHADGDVLKVFGVHARIDAIKSAGGVVIADECERPLT